MTPGAVGALAAISRHVGPFHAVSAYVYFLFKTDTFRLVC